MRRLLLTLLAASSVAFLPACSQGGSVYAGNTSKIDHVILTSAGQQPGVMKVVPGQSIVISAEGVSGSSNTIVPSDNVFSFAYGFTPAGTQYPNAVSGGTGTCNTVSGHTLLPVLIKPVAGTSDSITFTPPSPANFTSAAMGFGPAAVTSPGVGSYCLTVVATHVSDGVVGTATVDVSVNP